MRVKRVLCIVLSLAAVFSLMLIRESAAWINTKSGDPLSQELIAKSLRFEFAGTLGTYLKNEEGATVEEYILPGENLIIDNEGKITGTNYSTIATDVRFQVTYDKATSGGSVSTVCHGGSDEDLVISVGSGFTLDGDYFVRSFNAGSGAAVVFTLLNSVQFNEDVSSALYLPKDDSGDVHPHSGNVQVVVQAKQHDHMEWTDILTTP